MKFRVGEIAILLATPAWPENPECDCKIVAPARLFRASYSHRDRFDLWAYLFYLQYDVVDEAGVEWTVTEDVLRKKKPPEISHDVATWEECPWQPATAAAATEGK